MEEGIPLFGSSFSCNRKLYLQATPTNSPTFFYRHRGCSGDIIMKRDIPIIRSCEVANTSGCALWVRKFIQQAFVPIGPVILGGGGTSKRDVTAIRSFMQLASSIPPPPPHPPPPSLQHVTTCDNSSDLTIYWPITGKYKKLRISMIYQTRYQ